MTKTTIELSCTRNEWYNRPMGAPCPPSHDMDAIVQWSAQPGNGDKLVYAHRPRHVYENVTWVNTIRADADSVWYLDIYWQ